VKTYGLKKQLWLPQPREKLFEFFSDPYNLDRLTPAWLKFKILASGPVEMRQGTFLNYRLRIRGFPIRWQSQITAWNPPSRFIDRQTKGPYSLWIHEHRFEDCEGGSLIKDNVKYAVLGGSVVQKLFVAPDLERIFRYRHQVLEELFNPMKRQPSKSL
jgi:ligand-binding SRPBCC domain-containing protein